MATFVPGQPEHTCRVGGLAAAHSPTPAADGSRIYVICGCGTRLVLTPAQWRAEQKRREEEARSFRDDLRARVVTALAHGNKKGAT